MSLIIAMVTNEGIVAAADTRTTSDSFQNKYTRYFDGTKKVHPVYGRAVILNCGDNTLTSGLLINSFIEEFIRNDINPKEKIEIGYIAYSLLNKTLLTNPKANVTYLVAGYEDGKPCRYRVITRTKECICQSQECGASYNGTTTNICHAILNDCKYENLLLKNGVRLCECALYATHMSLTYSRTMPQAVGSQFDIYIIDKYGYKTGWVIENHEICKSMMRKQMLGIYPQNHVLTDRDNLL